MRTTARTTRKKVTIRRLRRQVWKLRQQLAAVRLDNEFLRLLTLPNT